MDPKIAPVSVKSLSVSYERKRVLTNIFLELKPGRIIGVVGPNGAGKSTLFKAILGLIKINHVHSVKMLNYFSLMNPLSVSIC